MSDDYRVPLREYVERIFDEKERSLEGRLLGEREALKLARESIEREMAKLNELRQEVTSDRGLLVTREVYLADMKSVRAWQDRADGAVAVVRMVGLTGAVTGLLALIAQIAQLFVGRP